jgi:hypothetical protein
VAPRPERRDPVARARLEERVAAEFREMPCMRLTGVQASRLFNLRADICDRVIESLVRRGILRRDGDGRYAAEDENASA